MVIADENRWGWRVPVVVVLVALSVLGAATAILTGWTRTTLIDTDGYVQALIEPLAADPEVKDAIATELANQMTQDSGAGIAASLQRWVPASAAPARAALAQWGAQIEQGWQQYLQPSIRAQLDLPTFTMLWAQANADAHRQLIAALSDTRTGTTVTLDLNAVAQESVREVGVQLDRQLGLPTPVGAVVYGAIAQSMPPESGQIKVDVSRIGKPARTAISAIDPIFALSLGAAVFFALLAVGAAPPRRRGTAVVLLGLGTLAVAGGLWYGVSYQAKGAGDRAAAVAVEPFSAEMRFVVDREADLAVESFRGWAMAAAGIGLGLVLIGGVWRIASGRAPRSDPFVDDGYASPEWDDTPITPPWSTRAY